MKNKKRTLNLIFAAVLILMCFSSPVCAENDTFDTDKLGHKAQSYLSAFSFENVMDIVTDEITKTLFPASKNLSLLLSMIIICSVAKTVSGDVVGGELIGYISSLCFSSALFSSISSLCTAVSEHVGKLRDIMLLISPTVIASTVPSGITTAKVGYTGLCVVLDVAELMATELVIPCARLLFVMAAISTAFPESPLKPISSSFRTFTLFFVSLTMTSIVTVLYFQDVIARGIDSIGARAVRFASVSFIPLVGNLVGESLRVITQALGALRGITGAVGVYSVITALLPPLAAIVVFKLQMIFCGCVSRVLGCEREGDFFSQINSLLNILNAALLASTLAFSAVVVIVCKCV